MIIGTLTELTPYYEQQVKSCFNFLSEKDRKMIWSDGNYHDCEGKFYLAFSENKVIGVLIVSTDYIEIDKPFVKTVETVTLFVRPDYRRKHVGQMLLEIAMRQGETELVMAKVRKDSIQLFLNCGFILEEGDKFADILLPEQLMMIGNKRR